MKETKRKNITSLPYSLHDAHIRKIKIKGKTIKVFFDKGYYMPKNHDWVPVDGYIEFQRADFLYCNVYIFSMEGNRGRFAGKKYSLKKFVKKYPKVDMEIIDETYGYNQSNFAGYCYKGKKIQDKEFMLEIYHLGSMKYVTKE